jgi:putative nucleotidyltransferase-like protein
MRKNPNWRSALSPERELVLLCACPNPDEAVSARVREILRGPLDWPSVAALAHDHHVETFLHENLKRAGGGLVPAEWAGNFHESARKAAGMSVLLSSELLRICEIFEKEGVPIVPYKGPVLGQLAYGTPAERRFVDLDFFVPHKEIARARDLLASGGYEAKFEIPDRSAGQSENVPGQYAFFRPATRAQIELHTERTLRYFPVPLDFEKMSRRLIDVVLCGRRVPTFSIEDTLVMLCVHGSKHFWERLLWILDVAQLVRTQKVDWALLGGIAAKLESTRVVLLGLCLAQDFFDAPLPAQLREEIGRDRVIGELAEKVGEQFAGISTPAAGAVPRALLRIRMRDGIGQGLRHTWRLALSPTESDRQKVSLPLWLAPLYMLVRPWRLLREYGSGLKRR